MLRRNFKRFLAISMVFSTLFTTTAFATPIDLVNSAQDVKNDTLNQDTGTTYYDDELTNEWNNGTIPEEVRVKVNLASQFTITIPKEIMLDGSTGKADYVVNAKGDIAGDQVLVVKPDNEFLLSEKGGKEDITATVVQPDTEYVYTDLQGDGTEYDGSIAATLTAGEWSGKFNFNINFKAKGFPKQGLSLEEYSWDEIAQISEAGLSEDYFNVGDEKTITLNSTSTASLNTLADTGETYTLQIIGLNHDDLADGSGKAGITFQFKECIERNVINNSTQYPYGDSRGGWENFKIRSRLNNEIYNFLPNEIKNKIKEVNKICDNGYGDMTLNNTTDKLFLLSFDEVGFEFMYPTLSSDYMVIGQGNIYEYYIDTTTNERIKYLNGSIVPYGWGLRSSYYNHIHHIGFIVTTSDTKYPGYTAMGANANGYELGISPAFCI